MIEIKNLNKYFNKGKRNEVHVINNTSLSLSDNGLVALLGPSGCGKTTLLNTIGGLDKAKSGSIYINNTKITSKSAYKKDKLRNLNIGYIFQDYKLVDDLSVYDNVALTLKMIGITDKKEIKLRVEYILEKVGMLRYKNRPAGMLSGGERQRVGIARAIAKDPEIILADEPTGNLDSKNTIEIMNIIKAISKERLVILVTHEQTLADFYATRIIRLKDGFVESDRLNEHTNNLDYTIDNTFYLKDFEAYDNLKSDNHDINIYSDGNEKTRLNIVIKNGNIYIKSETSHKIEVIDENSSIDFVDDHFKQMDLEALNNYEFNFRDVINTNIKKRYSSILNPLTLLINGFKKVFGFSAIKKILLAGFVLSGIFIMYAVSSIFSVLNVKDEDFIETNKNYNILSSTNIKVNDYLNYESYENVGYMIPGNSKISFNIELKDYYQTAQCQMTMTGSLASTSLITSSDLIHGRMPENDYEIVIDKMTLKNFMANDSSVQMSGITDIEDFAGRTISVPNMNPFTIVGISDLSSPSIYINESMFINVLYNASSIDSADYGYYSTDDKVESSSSYIDYTLQTDKYTLKQGRLPENDYEVIVNISNKETMPLNKQITEAVNGTKLTVVGYYTSRENMNSYFVNNNTIKYLLIEKSQDIAIYSSNKNATLETFRNQSLNINDSYVKSKTEYIQSRREDVVSSLIVSGIILIISLIEIFLMTRASFLSRVKEVGIYRAIGVKKSDIYKMFIGEVLAITTISSLPGILFAAYILNIAEGITYISNYVLINTTNVILTVIFIYIFNLIIGLIPVFNTIRKTPAAILARYDLE